MLTLPYTQPLIIQISAFFVTSLTINPQYLIPDIQLVLKKCFSEKNFHLGSDNKTHSNLFLIPRKKDLLTSTIHALKLTFFNLIKMQSIFKKTSRRWIWFWRSWQHLGARLLPWLWARRRCTFWYRRGLAVGRSFHRALRHESEKCCGPRIRTLAWVGSLIRSGSGNVSLVSRISWRRWFTWRR